LGEKTRRRTATPAELMTPMKASRSLEEIRELTDDNVGVEERTRSHSPTSATTTEIDAESTDSRAESVCSPSTSSHSHRIINRIASDQTPQRDQGIVEKMPVSRQSSVPYRSRIIEVASTSKLESMRQQSSLNRSHRKNGRIVPYTARTATGQRDRSAASRLLIRTHTLDGHTRAVLSVSANDTTVITGSKDRLAKLWDLERGVERCTFGLHQNNVNCVRLIPNSHLALSVSMSMVRLWDIRSEKCVYVLHSSGLATEGDAIPPSPSRQNTVPISETVINAAEPDPTGSLLFTSFCGDVRIWKVDKFASIGRLTGAAHGPRSEVSCLAVTSDHIPRVFTGSRDHYVKMYDVAPLDQCVFEARYEFSPPHYDNVTAILPYGDTLFTASKDSVCTFQQNF
uniref:WD_REPEATS_REGION domain-containing protein n=1 Tax=Anisakis simplex TaxID=6269 RepID=A0A0M3K7L8_ANISI